MTFPQYRGRHRGPDAAPRAAPTLLPGQELSDRYVLRERLSPAEPVSFRADDVLLNRSVTVSFLILDSDYAELVHGSEDVEGISALRHPALASLFDVGHDPAVHESYLVTDYVDGLALSDLLASPLPKATIRAVTAHVNARVDDLVAYLEQRGLRHTDLSPTNIRVALTDGEPGESPLVRVGLLGLHTSG
jgi:serine/threonine protein kinase